MQLRKKKNLFNAEVLNFPKDKKIKVSNNIKLDKEGYWKINDNSNSDQLKAITGICLMFGFLLILGIVANLTFI